MRPSMKIWGILVVLMLAMTAALPANAASGKPSIAIADVSVSPAALMPGDTGTITVTVTDPAQSLSGDSRAITDTYNYGSGVSNGLTTPEHSEQTTVQSSDTPDGAIMLKEVSLLADPPIRVVSSYQFLDVGRIGAGCTYKFTFIVRADDGAPDGSYFATVRVRTDDGDVYLNYPVAIKVDGTPLNLSVSDSPKAFAADKQTVSLNVVNDRSSDITGIAVIPSGRGLDFSPRDQYVIGAIGAGDSSTAQFDVSADNASSAGDPSFTVIYYNGGNRHESGPVALQTAHAGVAASASYSAGDSGALFVAGFVIVFAILIGGFFLYLRGRRAKP